MSQFLLGELIIVHVLLVLWTDPKRWAFFPSEESEPSSGKLASPFPPMPNPKAASLLGLLLLEKLLQVLYHMLKSESSRKAPRNVIK